MEWFRSYHGAPFDPKWRVIAKQAGARAGDVAVVFWALMDYASQASERGVTHGDATERHSRCEEIGIALDLDVDVVEAIYTAFEARSVIIDGRLAAWEKRQPKREDSSTERTRAYRERKVTHGDASVTHGDAREEQRRTERKSTATDETPEFLQFWTAYPEKIGKAAARRAFATALPKTSLLAMLASLDRYKASKPSDRAWCHPATWLNQERWHDQPAPAGGSVVSHPALGRAWS